jgi:anti-sigma-K factor RskA
MSEHDVHTLTGAYATHALPEDERREFDDHLAQCPACRQEVAELAATAGRLGAAASAPAPATLRDRVLAEVARTRQVSPRVTDLADRRRPVPWYRQPLGVAASFLMVLALGLGAFAATESRRADRAEETAAQITAVVTDPDRAETTRPISSGGASMLIAAGDRAIFRADGVRVLPSNRTYQLWVMDDKGGARSVGLLGRGSSRHLQQFIEGVKPTDQVGLTVEPEGGSPGPTTAPLVALPVTA